MYAGVLANFAKKKLNPKISPKLFSYYAFRLYLHCKKVSYFMKLKYLFTIP